MAAKQKLGQIKQAGRPTKIYSTMDKELLNVHHAKEVKHEAVSKGVTNQVVSNNNPPPMGGDVVSSLQGMAAQAQAMVSAAVGLPGIQDIGTKIASMGADITGAGGTAGIASSITGIGTSMAAGGMAGMPALLSSLTSQISALASMIDPTGQMSKVVHSDILSTAKGIANSAFNGSHTTELAQAGIALMSTGKIASTAPSLPHNGTVLNSDNVYTTGQSLAASFPLISDARLKTHIEDHPSVLESIMALKLKRFRVKSVDWECEEAIHSEPSRPSIGLIAQEVQKLFPLLVHGEKFLAVEESKVGLLLLAAFQEFVIEVRADIAELKAKNDA